MKPKPKPQTLADLKAKRKPCYACKGSKLLKYEGRPMRCPVCVE